MQHATPPKPHSTPPEISVHDLAALPGTPGVDYIVIDVRRTDIIGDEGAARGMIPGAVNLPAQTFYTGVGALGRVLKDIPLVIFHCNSCSPGGRGRRTAAWYQDTLDARDVTTSKALVLAGGWKAWVAAFPDRVVAV